jgi:hypothetical protein
MSRSLNSKLAYGALGAVFLATVIYVLTVLPGRSAPPPTANPSPVAHSDGLTDSFSGYLMRPVTLPAQRGTAVPIAFQIIGLDGLPLKQYETVQTKQLHLYLIRDDMSGFQHLHPVLAEGIWSTTADITDGGSYRLYAEFTPPGWGAPGGHPVILGLNFIITGDTLLRPMPGPAASANADGYLVTRLDGTAHLKVGEGSILRFSVGDAVLEPYLGALAHISAFEVRTQALAHLHPAGSEIAFMSVFVNRGEYRLFVEFQAGGKLHVAAFTVFVT